MTDAKDIAERIIKHTHVYPGQYCLWDDAQKTARAYLDLLAENEWHDGKLFPSGGRTAIFIS